MGNMIATALSDFGFEYVLGEVIVGGGRSSTGAASNAMSGFYPNTKYAIPSASFSVLKICKVWSFCICLL